MSNNDNNDAATTVTRKTYPRAPVFTNSPFAVPVKKVTIAGGTHGNEYTGVWCIKAIEKQRESLMNECDDDTNSKGDKNPINVFKDYPSLDIDTLLANPMAYMANKRFIDTDLNREFSMEKLKRVKVDEETMELCDIQQEFCSEDDATLSSLPHEAIRAREIETILGPKFTESSAPNGDAAYPDPLMDIVIDLHTTTANMGISLIIPEGDALMSAAAAYVLNKCKNEYGYDNVQCCMHALPKRQDRMNLSSCGKHGFTIEVGPSPQGVIRHDVVEKTEAALHSLLEFLHLRNLELEKGDDANEKSVLDHLREIYPGGIVPCYRSAPAVRPGELSGKISWPNDPENPNFPAVMVHKSIQDRDFEPLRVGDPLFVSLDGKVIPYDGSHGEEVHLIFVNEGGY
jgi:succinylglutamate desuccinylase